MDDLPDTHGRCLCPADSTRLQAEEMAGLFALWRCPDRYGSPILWHLSPAGKPAVCAPGNVRIWRVCGLDGRIHCQGKTSICGQNDLLLPQLVPVCLLLHLWQCLIRPEELYGFSD